MTPRQARVSYLVCRAGYQMLKCDGDPQEDIDYAASLMEHFRQALVEMGEEVPE